MPCDVLFRESDFLRAKNWFDGLNWFITIGRLSSEFDDVVVSILLYGWWIFPCE